ncbi:MAG: 30S ribosomal protein S12 methylthiotransferase RimO [Eubacteriales bacterium]|nr:30S ribosomal protein S12 methylthiotransferase RimO [Eubacteriales bacterium]
MPGKVCLVSLGCPKNLIDSETMLGILKKSGWTIVSEREEADAIIVNTCSFVQDARKESVNAILEAENYKKRGNASILAVAGCLAQMYGEDILSELDEVDAVVGTGSVQNILEALENAKEGKRRCYLADPDLNPFINDREVSTPQGQAYLKIAEGCSNKCTYCVIPKIRGIFRSRKFSEILDEAKSLVKNGVKEITLVAQDTTRFGSDESGKPQLYLLLKKLGEIDGTKWLRILYCYPELVDDDLIMQYFENDKLVKYIDMPIQHASIKILKLMGRKSDAAGIASIIEKLRKRVPDIVIRTSLIVGFPGETEEDFRILHDFVKKYRFDRLGVFRYSKEDGTPAARMKGQVPEKTKIKRYNSIMKLQKQISLEINKARIGKSYKTLVEGVAEDGIFYKGRTYAEAPEIDGSIYFASERPLKTGEFVQVEILDAQEYDLTGVVRDEIEYSQ